MLSPINFFHFPDVSLNLIKDSDIGTTVGMINKAYSYQDSYKKAPRTNDEHLRQRVNESQFYVAKQDEQIVGCIYVERSGESVHFGLLTVVDKMRGAGLGAALIKSVEAYAKELSVQKVELDYMSIASWLKTYYERHGYAENGEVTRWGNIDLIRMSKLLR